MTGCRVLNSPPAGPRPEPTTPDPAREAEIRTVIEGTRSELDRCYLEALAVWPQLEGRVVLDITIQANGMTRDTAVAMHNSSIFDATVGCCIARVADSWRFPEPKDGKPLEIEYPFELMTDILKVRFSTSVVTTSTFNSRFPATVLIAAPQPASGTDIHHTW
ncbi:MAG TPA: AgmX/PglI C-terminal domain-containing protein [Polyangiales bacterium]|nr:AgmX/PglI C-terminal domain-containing protein [Polyangiales bacterium]